MGRNRSISLDDHFEDFVDKRVSTGRLKNASEVVRAGPRLLEEEENNVTALKTTIVVGIESGVVKNFDPKRHLSKLKTSKRKNA